MTAIDRTIYCRMKRSYITKELIEAYTSTEEERWFVSTMTRTVQNQLNLMVWIKLFPCLGYFPALSEIPAPLVDHIRKALDLAADVVPGYDHDRTLYRHHQVVHEYYQIIPYGRDARRVALRTVLRAIRTMDNPADLINAAIDELIKQRYELPAFSTLDRLAGRIRALVYGRIFRMVATRITPSAQQIFETLLDAGTPLHRSYFSLLKLAPPSPTLSHLKSWQDRLSWLLQLGSMEPLVHTGTCLWVGHVQPTRIRRVAWSPDGSQLASCGDDGSVCLWQASDGRLQASLQGHSGIVMSVAWSPDGTRLASGGGGSGSGEISIWDIQSGKRLLRWNEPNAIVDALTWSPTGEVLISGSSDGNLRWWDIQHGKCLVLRQGHQGAVQSLRASPDGQRLASCGDDSIIQVWNLQSGEHLQTLRRDRPYERLNIKGIRGLSEAQKSTLRALGTFENDPVPDMPHVP